MEIKKGDIVRVKSGDYGTIKIGTIGNVIAVYDNSHYISIRIINCPTYKNYSKERTYEVYLKDIELLSEKNINVITGIVY